MANGETTLLSCLLRLTACAGQAQQTVHPPPNPNDNEPSPADTMKFIRDVFYDQGERAMKTAKKAGWFYAVACLTMLTTPAARAQQNVPPPPNPNANGDNGPSLGVTMKFIQDKLDLAGTNGDQSLSTSTITKSALSASASDLTANLSYRVTVDANACTFRQFFKSVPEMEFSAYFKDIAAINVDGTTITVQGKTTSAFSTHWNTKDSHIKDKKDYPDVAVGKWEIFHVFAVGEDDLADRVGKAMVHAVDLCVGGTKDPF